MSEDLQGHEGKKTSGLAIAALVVSILGLFTCGLLAPVGLILGIVALITINGSEGRLGGQGMAIASTVLSGVMSLLFIPIVAAIAIPNLVASRQVANETSAIASLTVVLSAQATFHRTDFYGKGEPVYANPVDGNGFSDLFSIGRDTPSPKVIGLIDSSLANASIGSGTPKHGYYFADVTMSGDGNPFEHAIEFAICAVPAAYGRSGRNIYIMDVSGSIYMADAESIYQGLRSGDPVRPLDKYPTQDELSARWSMAGM